jgi:acetyl esterase/lipase
VITATDYQGLGTPGEPTYLDGVAEGHAVLDSIRAARQLPGVGTLGPVVIAGHSQGGGAALWSAQLAHSYSPEFDVRGVVALAPAAELTTIVQMIGSPPYNAYLGYVLLATDGLHTSYGRSFDPSKLLTPAGLRDLVRVSNECAEATIARWRGRPISSLEARDPLSIPSVASILEANSLGTTAPGVPVFLGQGDHDAQVPLQVSAQLEAKYCQLGAVVTRHVYTGADHDQVLDAASNDVLSWIDDRYAGHPAPNDC